LRSSHVDPCKEELFRNADSKPEHDRINLAKPCYICQTIRIEQPLVVAW